MRGRIILAIITAGALLAIVLMMPRRGYGEPRYDGVPLHDCVRFLVAATSPDQAVQAQTALSKFGTNDLLYLVRWIQYEPSAWRRGFARAVAWVPLGGRPARRLANWIVADHRADLAQGSLYALIVMGNQGRAFSATGPLLQVLNVPGKPQTADRAIIALSSMGQTAPIILALQRPEHPYQPEMREAIASILVEGPPLMQAQVSNELAHLAPKLLTNLPRSYQRRSH